MYNNHDNKFDETRKIETISSNDLISNTRPDIEITDTKGKKPANSGKFSSFRKKYFNKPGVWILAIVFVIALLGGFFLSSYYNDKKQLAENDSIHQQQEVKNQLAQISDQRKELEKERKQLEAEKAALASDQNAPEEKQSWLGSVIDTITGEKAQKDKQKADSKTEFDQKIAQAQTKIDDINNNLNDLDSMKNKLSDAQQQITNEYYKNKDIIDFVKINLQKLFE